jgi:hypothetical protein
MVLVMVVGIKINLLQSLVLSPRRVCARGIAAALLACPLAAISQAAPAPMVQGSSPIAQRMEAERLKMAAEQRQQKLQSDADKLLQLAQQLKVSVDKTNKNTLSVQVVREAETIEKLARQVKDGMKQ